MGYRLSGGKEHAFDLFMETENDGAITVDALIDYAIGDYMRRQPDDAEVVAFNKRYDELVEALKDDIKRFKFKTCEKWYPLKDEILTPAGVIILTSPEELSAEMEHLYKDWAGDISWVVDATKYIIGYFGFLTDLDRDGVVRLYRRKELNKRLLTASIVFCNMLNERYLSCACAA